jgi:superfamily I DNA/RNA helicase
VLGNHHDLGRRLDAVQRIEQLILSLLIWEDVEVRRAGRERQLEVLGRRKDWLREAAGMLVARLKGITNPDAFGKVARAALGEILGPLPHETLSDKVKKPDQSVWSDCTAAVESGGTGLQCSTVHAAKGAEFPAVLVVIPATLKKVDGRNVLEEWEAGGNTEARRVLYVAASRAQRLLAFGAGKHQDQVAGILWKYGVPSTRL